MRKHDPLSNITIINAENDEEVVVAVVVLVA